MRVLVCGGRDYDDSDFMALVLDDQHAVAPISLLIAGGAPGADTLAVQWAGNRGIDFVIEPADWQLYGRAAGPIRNQVMLTKLAPDLVIAFGGGRGTSDMLKKAERAGVKVVRLEHGQ